ncbi:MAG: CidA/LrgA family protein [Rhodobacterales bacterium]|nr:CidA/LrgA family protein [Rhodobacterales bacterium]
MIPAFLILLSCQLAGETAARALALPLPGPVLGMLILTAALALRPGLQARMEPLAQGILGNLSLLFVPAGVGVVGHLGALGQAGLPLMAALVGSTVLAIGVGAVTFAAVARLTGAPK